MVALAAAGPSAYWYLARGTGVVALLLLTAAVVLGILDVQRFTARRWPRFVVDRLHRDVSLLVLAVLVVHIVTSVLDSFAPITLLDAFVPLTSAYRPLWLGLGAIAFDVLLAVAITSMVRRRLGYRAWRAVHWLAYASWPVAVLHGLGTGSDTKIWWMLLLTTACVAAVTVAICVRVARAERPRPGLQGPAIALSVATPIALAVFTVAGPLAKGWARRAGTPANLLAPRIAATSPARTVPVAYVPRPFSAALSGSLRQAQLQVGAIVDLDLRLTGSTTGQLRLRLAGAPLGGGGLSLTGSQVDLIAKGVPTVLAGQITALQGDDLVARVLGSGGTAYTLAVHLHIDQQTNAVTGTLSASPSRGQR
jgi:methionine sulfoxide reductase heme-binding subunit